MRSCPFTNCPEKISGASFCCGRHWSEMTHRQRDDAFDVFALYKRREVTFEELENLRAALVEEIEFSRNIGAMHLVCRCGVALIEATLSVGCPSVKLLLEPGHCDGGQFVVVGGKAFSGADAARLLKSSPALARLNPHSCWACENGRPKRASEAA